MCPDCPDCQGRGYRVISKTWSGKVSALFERVKCRRCRSSGSLMFCELVPSEREVSCFET
jgi:hypothetical protein